MVSKGYLSGTGRYGVVPGGTGWYVVLWCGTEWYGEVHPALGVESMLLVNAIHIPRLWLNVECAKKPVIF